MKLELLCLRYLIYIREILRKGQGSRLKSLNVQGTVSPEASPAATTATPGDPVPLEGNSRADLPEIVIILVAKFQHRREKSILLFGAFVTLQVDVRKQVLEAEGTQEDVRKSSLDDGTQDKLQMKILCYMSELAERLK